MVNQIALHGNSFIFAFVGCQRDDLFSAVVVVVVALVMPSARVAGCCQWRELCGCWTCCTRKQTETWKAPLTLVQVCATNRNLVEPHHAQNPRES
jgi:hypothetical protein